MEAEGALALAAQAETAHGNPIITMWGGPAEAGQARMQLILEASTWSQTISGQGLQTSHLWSRVHGTQKIHPSV